MILIWPYYEESDSSYSLASFPAPAQLSVAYSTVKWERAWYLFSRE